MWTNNKFNNSPRYREKMRTAWAVESYQDAVNRTKENTIETIDRTSEGEILWTWVIEKLKNLREYLPWEMDFLYDFADFLSTRANNQLVPSWFNLMAELAIHDLTNWTDWFNNNQPISHKVAWYPAMMYSLTRHMLPKIAWAIFSEEYWGEVKQVQDEVFDSIKKKRLEENTR